MTDKECKIIQLRHVNQWFGVFLQIANELWYTEDEEGFRKWIFFGVSSFGKPDQTNRAYSIVLLNIKFTFGRAYD